MCILSKPLLACDGKEVVISGRMNYPPLSWLSTSGLKGSTIAIVQSALADLGIESRTVGDIPWKRVLKNAGQGDIDIIVGVRKTQERNEYLEFIEPAITPAVQALFYHVDREVKYERWRDLQSLTGSVVLGSSFGKDFDFFLLQNLDVERVETMEQNFQKLIRNRVDYILGPYATTTLFLEKEGLETQIVTNRKPIVVLDEYIAVSKASPCVSVADQLSTVLNQKLDNGDLEKAMEAHFIEWFEEFGITDDMYY